MKTLSTKEKDLMKEFSKLYPQYAFEKNKEMYLKETDRNYKDGDRN